MLCISPTNNGTCERCTNIAPNGSKFCVTHGSLYKSLYLKYKEKEKSVSYLLEDDFELDQDLTTLLRYYNRLKEAYNLRREFRQKAIHPSAWDNGHGMHMSKILKRIISLTNAIKRKSREMRKEVTNKEEDINKEEESDEAAYQIIQDNMKEKSSDTSSQINNRHKEESIDIKNEENYLNEILSETVKYKDEYIAKFNDVLTALKGFFIKEEPTLNYTEEFLSFIILKITPLWVKLGYLLVDEDLYYIKTSPLRKIPLEIKDLTYAEVIRIGCSDLILNSMYYSANELKYFYQLYKEGIERGYCLYRYYKPSRCKYAVTFISGISSPLVLCIELKPNNTTVIIDYYYPNKEEINISTCYASYKTKYTNKYDVVNMTNMYNWKDKSGKRSVGIFNLLCMEYIVSGIDALFDLQPVVNLIHRRHSDFHLFLKYFKNYDGMKDFHTLQNKNNLK